MKVEISERHQYELHVKILVSKLKFSDNWKTPIRKLAMQCFDDGVAMNLDNLKVDVDA